MVVHWCQLMRNHSHLLVIPLMQSSGEEMYMASGPLVIVELKVSAFCSSSFSSDLLSVRATPYNRHYIHVLLLLCMCSISVMLHYLHRLHAVGPKVGVPL